MRAYFLVIAELFDAKGDQLEEKRVPIKGGLMGESNMMGCSSIATLERFLITLVRC